jgi:hypothetical protein
MPNRVPVLAILIASITTPAFPADVTSAKADATAVTIYRDRPTRTEDLADHGDDDTHGLALIVEARTVDVPAGRSRLRFEGVADGIIPESAGVDGLPAAVIERDFDYDMLTPATLIERSVGHTVQVVRTDRKTGSETTESAVIRSGPDGVVLDIGGRIEALHCSGGAERLVFDHTPPGLAARPTLSLAINSPVAGRYAVRLSYLTVRMDWSADYIARVAPDGQSLALTGWITLANRTTTSFENAPTEVVAGHLARVPVDIAEANAPPLETRCWPGQTTHAGWREFVALQLRAKASAPLAESAAADTIGEVIVTAEKRAIESQLGDYKLYTLAEPTTVASRQTKQVLFLDQPAVKFQTVYTYRVDGSQEAPDTSDAPLAAPTTVVLRLKNTTDQGLGRPLPEGAVQVRQPQSLAGGRELLLGDPALGRDVPVGEPFEIGLAQASDVTVRATLVSDTPRGRLRARRAYEILAANAKTAPVTVEIRHARDGADGFKVVAESASHGLKAGDPVWRLTLPAQSERTLTYTVELAR